MKRERRSDGKSNNVQSSDSVFPPGSLQLLPAPGSSGSRSFDYGSGTSTQLQLESGPVFFGSRSFDTGFGASTAETSRPLVCSRLPLLSRARRAENGRVITLGEEEMEELLRAPRQPPVMKMGPLLSRARRAEHDRVVTLVEK